VTVAASGCSGVAFAAVERTGAGAHSGEAVAVKSATPDAKGDFSIALTVPADTPVGEYLVTAYCEESYNGYNGSGRFSYESQSVAVLAAVGVTTTTPATPISGSGPVGTTPTSPAGSPAQSGQAGSSGSSGSRLARTGSSVGTLALLGAALTLVGGGLYLTSKRNRTA
jgi:LPXTG-motif cell wall-anchored protein